MKDLFDEIDQEKEELPRIRTITREVQKQKLNGYQMIAVVVFIILFIIGILLGNMFPACEATGMFGTCSKVQFNLSLSILFWFGSFLICLFFYALGHIIELLTQINSHLSKENSKKIKK